MPFARVARAPETGLPHEPGHAKGTDADALSLELRVDAGRAVRLSAERVGLSAGARSTRSRSPTSAT